MAAPLTIVGRAALSAARRARVLAKVKAAFPSVSAIDARWAHVIATARPLTAPEVAQLEAMLAYGPSDQASTVNRASGAFWIAPRIGTTSPWSSKATDIAHVCGLEGVLRIERAFAYTFASIDLRTAAGGAARPDSSGSIDLRTAKPLDAKAVGALLADRMTESVLTSELELGTMIAPPGQPRPLTTVALGADGVATLTSASRRLGLALSDDEIVYLVKRYGELGRDPTDVELMMFAQANSEHCRHKIFNAEFHIGGVRQDKSLFDLIKRSTEASPMGVLSAYKDNAAVVEGSTAMRLFPDEQNVYRGVSEPVHILGKVETHNHPTAISPFPGAATGSGGEIRDEGATGRGAKPKAGLVGFTVSDLRLPGGLEPWEPSADAWIGSPSRIATALDIMTEGPLGGAAFNNEFGRPAILGYFRTYERAGRGYHKPVMLAGGIGAIRAAHVQKAKVPDGAALIVLGGPAFLIGLGGGAASSLAQGASAEDLDFASVQRENAEIQRRCQEVIDRCWALGDTNPILSIHDVGAGGLSNAMPEIVHDAGLGATLELRAIPTGEPDLSPLELWSCEAQERYVLAIDPSRVAELAALCTRERAPWAQLGVARADGQLFVGDRDGGPTPVDIPLELMLGKAPRMVRRAEVIPLSVDKLDLGGATVAEALDRVLGLPTVADKSFLITIGDRTVGGMVARDPMVGRFQVPVADCALTTAGFDTHAGEVMSLGERPPVALLDAAAASRLAIGEAITNIAAVPIGALGKIKLSCNWMAAAGHPGEDARLYAGVRAASELSVALGISIPVGKDSMSMRTVWDAPGVPQLISPVSVVTQPVDVAVAQEMLRLEREIAADQKSAPPVPPTTDFDKFLAEVDRKAEVDRLANIGSTRETIPELQVYSRSDSRPVDTTSADQKIANAVAAADWMERKTTGGLDTSFGSSVPPATPRVVTRDRAQRTVVSPVTLVVTAFGPVTDVRKALTPELVGGETSLLLVDLGGGKARLGASCLAQVYGQVGDVPPDLDDPQRLAQTFAALQELLAADKLLAYHDRSDGGVIVTLLEMAFASGLGLDLDTTTVHVDPHAALFSEELGAVVEVRNTDIAHVRSALTAAGAQVHAIGTSTAADTVRVTHAGKVVVDATRTKLRARWSHVTHAMAMRRDDPTCAAEEHATRLDSDAPGLTAHLTFDPNPAPTTPPSGPPRSVARPKVAILREQGVNGQIEMATAFHLAGFDAVDVHMTDLIEGRVDLQGFRGAVACGGFSFGDVLGAGRGWASTFRYNARARTALDAFTARPDTFLLGVCNGCQMLADLADQLPGAAHWPRFVRNRSEQFEARVVLLNIEQSPSIFFAGMQGSRIPVANAHGEGRAELSPEQLAAVSSAGLVAARYVDGHGAVATTYPANPNGSPGGVASLTTADGRLTIMMPHPERVFRTAQLSWKPRTWTFDHSPWMRMFHNARTWVG